VSKCWTQGESGHRSQQPKYKREKIVFTIHDAKRSKEITVLGPLHARVGKKRLLLEPKRRGTGRRLFISASKGNAVVKRSRGSLNMKKGIWRRCCESGRQKPAPQLSTRVSLRRSPPIDTSTEENLLAKIQE